MQINLNHKQLALLLANRSLTIDQDNLEIDDDEITIIIDPAHNVQDKLDVAHAMMEFAIKGIDTTL